MWDKLPKYVQFKIIKCLGLHGRIAFRIPPAKLKLPKISFRRPVDRGAHVVDLGWGFGRPEAKYILGYSSGGLAYNFYVYQNGDDVFVLDSNTNTWSRLANPHSLLRGPESL